MRFSKTSWLVLGIGAFVIIFATLFTIYAGQSGEQEGLKKSLAEAQTQSLKLISGRESLENQLTQKQGRLAEVQALLNKTQASFSKSPMGIEYGEVLTDIAKDCKLEILSITAQEPYTKKIENITFLVTSFNVEVRGDVNNILSMVNSIANDEHFVSAGVEAVSIVVPEVVSVIPLGGVPLEKPTGTIRLVGYSYGGG